MRFALVALLSLFPLTAFANEEDKGFLTRLLEDNLSGAGRQVDIQGFQGALSSRATMSSMTIADEEGVWLRLTDVTLNWQRTALFTGRLEVQSLTAAEIDLSRLPASEGGAPTPEATPFALPELPISVNIEQVQAERIILGPTVLGRPVEASLTGQLRLSGGEGNARIELKRIDEMAGTFLIDGAFANANRNLRLNLNLAEPQGGIAATMIGLPGAPALNLTVTGDSPLEDFTAKIALASEGQNRVQGTVQVAAPEDGGTRFALDLGGDVTPLFLPDYRPFFGPDVRLKARGQTLVEGGMELEELWLQTAALSVQGQAKIAADGLPQKLDVRLDLASQNGRPVQLPLSGDPVMVGSGDLRLTFDAAQGSDGWSLTGNLRALKTPLMSAQAFALNGKGLIGRGQNDAQSVSGQVQFEGQGLDFTDPALASAIGSSLVGSTDFDWIKDQPLRLPNLTITGQAYEAKGLVEVGGQPTDPQITSDLTVKAANLAQFSGLAGRPLGGAGDIAWVGKIAPISGAFDGQLQVQGQAIALNIPEADRLLSGASRLRLDAMRGAEGLEIRDLSLLAESLNLQGKGWVRSTGPDLQLDLGFADLADLGASYGGNLQSQVRLTGTSLTDNLHLIVQALGQDLRMGQPQVDGFLAGQTKIDGAAFWRDATLGIESLTLTGRDFKAQAQGTLSQTLRDLTASFDLGNLAKAGAGFGGGLKGDLTYQLTEGRELASLQATGTNLSIGQPEADRLLRGTTDLSAKASRQGEIIRLEGLRLTNPQLSATAEATQTEGAQRRIDLRAQLNDLSLMVPGIPGALTLGGIIREDNGQLSLDLTASGPGGINGKLGGTAALNFATTNLTAVGTADAALANAFLGPVAMRGPISYNLAMNGAPSLAALSGQITPQNLRVTLTSPPMAFSNLAGTITLANQRANLALRTSADNGGQILIDGGLALSAPFDGNLGVTLNNLTLRDPRLYNTQASGRVTINGPLAGGAQIAGRIMLADTELLIPSTGLGGSAAIPDMRHIAEPARVRQTRVRAGLLGDGATASGTGGGQGPVYGLDIFIAAPQQVFVRGRGLDAELGGTFRITGTTANVIPSGGLELIRGRLDLLGKRFAFTEGQLQMEGSLVPTIRLVATTDTVDGTAAVSIDGPADAPVISFTSSPALPEEEVVARLLFGRGLTSLTPIQAAQLASAVATLTGKGGVGIVDRLRKNFGLDDFDISTSDSGAAALRAGRYLSDNIYLDLKLDSEGKSQVSINLDVTSSVTIRGRAAADGDAGIGIHYERDY